MDAPCQRIMLYANDPERSARFYALHFGFRASPENEGLIELNHPRGGLQLLIHRAAKSLRGNQARIKLMFDVEDIEAFKTRALNNGLEFGPTHQANGYGFANAKDPDGNGVSVSSRAFRNAASQD